VTHQRRLGAVVLTTVLLAAVACSNQGDTSPATTVVASTTTVAPSNVGDDELVLGLLLPTSDTAIGAPMVSAAELAVERINDTGGVLGRMVRTRLVDEGDTSASASAAVQTLLAEGVDAIIGPGSSVIALSTLDDIVSSGTLACSPTASALALDEFPDDGLFFRTVPSDSLQARAIAETADQTGALQATVIHTDDAYGRAFAASVELAMADGAVSVGETIAFSGRDDNLRDEAQRVVDAGAPVAIVLADGDDGTRFLETLGQFDTGGLASIVVNDALRNPATPQRIAGLDPSLRDKIIGLGPQAESSDEPFDPPGLFAANAYDCVNLVALAAVRADSDAPREIANQMAAVSSSGSLCRTFADCVEGIESGLQVDYNGPTGVTELSGRTGDPSSAVFDRFVYGPDGRDSVQQTVVVRG
jgi:branched-chain amino acid transport system substrate-binding protein